MSSFGGRDVRTGICAYLMRGHVSKLTAPLKDDTGSVSGRSGGRGCETRGKEPRLQGEASLSLQSEVGIYVDQTIAKQVNQMRARGPGGQPSGLPSIRRAWWRGRGLRRCPEWAVNPRSAVHRLSIIRGVTWPLWASVPAVTWQRRLGITQTCFPGRRAPGPRPAPASLAVRPADVRVPARGMR